LNRLRRPVFLDREIIFFQIRDERATLFCLHGKQDIDQIDIDTNRLVLGRGTCRNSQKRCKISNEPTHLVMIIVWSQAMEAAILHLRTCDPILAKIIERVGPCTMAPRRDYFPSLCRAIFAQQLSTKSYPVRAVDISELDQVRAAAGDFDAVVHAASTRGGDSDSYRRVYLNGACNLLERFPKSRMLFTSSTSVYAQADGEPVTEKSAAEPKVETGNILRATEDWILANGGIVVRLGGIYGPGRSALLKKFLNGEAIVDPEGDRFVNAIHRDDAAAAGIGRACSPRRP